MKHRASASAPAASHALRLTPRRIAAALMIAAIGVVIGGLLWRSFFAPSRPPMPAPGASSAHPRTAADPAAVPPAAAGPGLGAGASTALPFGQGAATPELNAVSSGSKPPAATAPSTPLPADVAVLRAGSPGWRAPIFELIEQRKAAESRKADEKKAPPR